MIVAGFGSLFSGAALLTNILAGFSLPLALALTATLVVGGIGALLARTSGARRRALLRMAMAGVATGIVATVCYDVAKYALSQLDPSPYNPFEATRVFGVLLLGSETHPLVQTAGWSFHLLNGTSFGLAYCFLFSRGGRSSFLYAALSGMGWGLFLEMFQLVLYPGWLDILFLEEFRQISAISHLVYGAVLGLTCRQVLRSGLIARDSRPP